jgi:hypothetical protein
VLESDPGNAEAHLVLGRWYCFSRNEWEKGVPMLALGKDPALKALAAKELEGAGSTDAQLALGDGWWELAEKVNDDSAAAMRARAVYWYAKAAPNLSGVTRMRVEQRMVVFLDDLREVRSQVGVARDSSGVHQAVVGKHGESGYNSPIFKKIMFQGVVPAHALSTLATENGSSYVVYHLDGKYRLFSATVAIAEAADAGARQKRRNPRFWTGRTRTPIVFRVIGDGRQLWKSDPITKVGAGQECQVVVRGVRELTLQVDCQGKSGFATTAWINPRVTP